MNHPNSYIEFRDASYIMAILRHGTLRSAARHLYISESALSQAIHAIERKWEFTLFQKSGGRLAPTAILEELLPVMEEIQDNGERFAISLKRLTHPETQFLRLGIVSLARDIAWPVIKTFIDQHGNHVQIEVLEHSTEEIVQHLLAHRLDAGIVLQSEHYPELNVRGISYHPLIRGQLLVIVPNQMLIASAKTISHDRLVRLPKVSYPRGYMIQDLLIKILGEPYHNSTVFVSTLKEWQQLMLDSGKAVMVLPDFCLDVVFPFSEKYHAIPLDPAIPVELAFTTANNQLPMVAKLFRAALASCKNSE